MFINFVLLVGSGATGQQLRSMLGLMRWLQLYMLADPAAAQPDVAVDLEGVYNGAFNNAKPAAGGPSAMQRCGLACKIDACRSPIFCTCIFTSSVRIAGAQTVVLWYWNTRNLLHKG